MKKKFLFLTIFFNIFISLSQENNTEFGIKLGMNYVSPSISNIGFSTLENEFGLNFGLFLNYNLSNQLTLIPELIFSTQNLKVIPPEQTTVKNSQNETYINIPIALKYKLNETFGLHLGPQIGYNINNSERVILGEKEEDGRRLLTFGKVEKRIYYSFNLGLNFKITERIGTEFRYNFGIAETNGFKNSVLQLNLKYIIK